MLHPAHGTHPTAHQPGLRLPVRTQGGDCVPEGVPPTRLPPKLTRHRPCVGHMRSLIPLSQNPMRLVPPTSQMGGRIHKPQATGPKPTASTAAKQRPNGEPGLCPKHPSSLYLGALFNALYSACSSSASIRVSPPGKPAWSLSPGCPSVCWAPPACPARALDAVCFLPSRLGLPRGEDCFSSPSPHRLAAVPGKQWVFPINN